MSRYPMPKAVAKAVIAREGGRCAVCGLPIRGTGHLHHRQPRGIGGSRYGNVPSNLLHLHHSCHLYKVEKDRATSYLYGWLVRHGDDPATTPVRYMMSGLVLLDDEGKVQQLHE